MKTPERALLQLSHNTNNIMYYKMYKVVGKEVRYNIMIYEMVLRAITNEGAWVQE